MVVIDGGAGSDFHTCQMKIIGITYIEGKCHITLKADTSLLIQGRPFFVPSWDSCFYAQPCLIVRICRLGKSIEGRFVHRYYDAVAYGLDFRAQDTLSSLRSQGADWSYAVSFDHSLCVGSFMKPEEISEAGYCMTITDAICTISRYYTLHQGDYLFIDHRSGGEIVELNKIYHISQGDKNLLYCKIK